MARLKAPAQAVPQNLLDAETLAVELGELMSVLEGHQRDLAGEIARLQLQAKAASDPLGKEIDAKFKALMGFATAHRTEILEPKRKSRNIAAGTIGWRTGNPKVEIEAGMEDVVIDFLDRFAPHLLVETVTIDKNGLIGDRATAAQVPHLDIKQTEQFFFKPLAVDLEKVKTTGKVAADAAEAA